MALDDICEGSEEVMNRYGLKRSIPEGIKLAVRRRDGFGCVVCGNAFTTYEHFDPEFANAKSHEAEGIILLCPNHHFGKDKIISRATIAAARDNPATYRKGYAGQEVDLGAGFPQISIGTVTGVGCDVLLHFFGEDVISFLPPEETDAPYRVNACIRDRWGAPILEIVENEIRTSVKNWDFEFTGTQISIRSAPRKIELRAQLEPGVGITFDRLRLWHRGFVLSVADGVVYGADRHYAFKVADARVDRRGGTVLFLSDDGLRIGKAPVYGSFGTARIGVAICLPRTAAGYRELVELARRGLSPT